MNLNATNSRRALRRCATSVRPLGLKTTGGATVTAPFLSSPGPQAADALDEIHDLCATAAGYAVSIQRCAERGSTARFAFELRQILACLSERVESLNRARKPEGAQ
jgi:hypothetical protein